MIKKIFDYLEGVKGVDGIAERVLGIMVPGAKVTNQERSDDPASPWIDTEFKFLGEVFTLRFVLVDGKHIMELMHNGNCMDIPDNASLPQFIIDHYFYRYQERIEVALGEMFEWKESHVEDPNGTELEIKGVLTAPGGTKYDVVFFAHTDDDTLCYRLYKEGECIGESKCFCIGASAQSQKELREHVREILETQERGIQVGSAQVCSNHLVTQEMYDKICKAIEGTNILEIQTHCDRVSLIANNEGNDKCRDIEEAGGYAVFDLMGPDGKLVQLVYSGPSDLVALETGLRVLFKYSQILNNTVYNMMNVLGIDK